MSAGLSSPRLHSTDTKFCTSHPSLFAVAAIALVALFIPAAAAQSTATSSEAAKPTIVLVHGAWADSSSWGKVIARLQDKGYRVLAPANPLRSLDGDAAYLASYLAQEVGPFVVVGHSYGGAVITNALARNANVKALVYINAFVPDIGEDIFHLAGADSLVPFSLRFKGFPPFGSTDVDAYIDVESFHPTLAGDLSSEHAAALAVTQRPIALAAGATPTTATAWRTIPSWYLIGLADKTITAAAQRVMATRAHCKIVEVDAAHLSMISQPGAVVRLIDEAARE